MEILLSILLIAAVAVLINHRSKKSKAHNGSQNNFSPPPVSDRPVEQMEIKD